MEAYETIGIILSAGLIFLMFLGMLSEGNGALNTWEKLHKQYLDSKTREREIDLEMMREETKQISLRMKDYKEDKS